MDRKLLSGTVALVGLLALNVFTLYQIEQVRQTIPDDPKWKIQEIDDHLNFLASGLDDAKQTADDAQSKAENAEYEAEKVAKALCRASNYSECP